MNNLKDLKISCYTASLITALESVCSILGVRNFSDSSNTIIHFFKVQEKLLVESKNIKAYVVAIIKLTSPLPIEDFFPDNIYLYGYSFYNFLKRLKDYEIINIEFINNELVLKYGNNTCSFGIQNGLIKRQDISGKHILDINVRIFKKMLSKINFLFGESISDIKQIVGSLFLYGDGKSLTIVCTDGFVIGICIYTFLEYKEIFIFNIILYSKILYSLIRILEDKEEISFWLINNMKSIYVYSPNICFTIDILSEKYIYYNKIIESILLEDHIKILLVTKKLEAALERASIIKNPTSYSSDILTLSISEDKLFIRMMGTYGKLVEEVPCIVSSFGNIDINISISLNSKDILKILKSIGIQSFFLIIKDSTFPCILETPAEIQDNNLNTLYILFPVILKS